MRAIELFAGAGGAALGLHRAGIEHAALVEWDASACATLRAAIGLGMLAGEVIEGDVRAVEWSRFARPDLVWGSPPCQEWSTAGKRAGAKGERNGWPWFLDAIDALRPTWVCAENVDGMLKHVGSAHPGGGPVTDVDACPACWFKAKLLPAFEARFASVQWTVYDAATLAVPQHRRRLILVAGPRPIVWPVETATRREIVPMFGTKRAYATVREALNLDVIGIATAHGPGERVADRDLRDLPARTVPADMGGSMRGGNMAVVENRGAIPQSRRPLALDAPADAVQAGSPTSNHAPVVRVLFTSGREIVLDPKHPAATPDAPAPALRSGGRGHSAPPAYLQSGVAAHDSGKRGAKRTIEAPAPAIGGSTQTHLGGSRPDLLDRPAYAVSATEVKGMSSESCVSKLNRASDGVYLATGIRRLTEAECAKLQSFPDDWPWVGNRTQTYRQIGNGVPPPLAEAIGRALLTAHQEP